MGRKEHKDHRSYDDHSDHYHHEHHHYGDIISRKHAIGHDSPSKHTPPMHLPKGVTLPEHLAEEIHVMSLEDTPIGKTLDAFKKDITPEGEISTE